MDLTTTGLMMATHPLQVLVAAISLFYASLALFRVS
jgi:hypothetical protein